MNKDPEMPLSAEALAHLALVKNKTPILRFWEIPSFEPVITWTIFIDIPSFGLYPNPMLRRVTGAAIRALTPTYLGGGLAPELQSQYPIIVEDCRLPPDILEGFDVFRKFTLPLFGDSNGGVDGSIYGFQSWPYPGSVILEWWESCPESWHELVDWAYEMRTYFDKLLKVDLDSFKDINQQFPPDHKIWTRIE